jgi:poly-beta-1,6-N-acetyl-D-glucosamine biosynthesis protein PgaD
MWVIYLYLIREVFGDLYLMVDEAFAWAFGHVPRSDLPTAFRFLYTLALYGVVVVVNGMLLIGWALYNQYRFRGRDSRKAIAAVSVDDLGRFHGFSGDEVARWQQARTLVIIHNGEGKLLAVMPTPMGEAGRDKSDRPVESPDTARPDGRRGSRASPTR